MVSRYSSEPDLTSYSTERCFKCKRKSKSGRFMEDGRWLCVKCSDIELGYSKKKEKVRK